MSIISKKNNSFVLVKNMDSDDETQKIKVKVLVLWKAYKSSGNMVLIDEESISDRSPCQNNRIFNQETIQSKSGLYFPKVLMETKPVQQHGKRPLLLSNWLPQ
ncbi:hypothetical protein YC2023_001375 [Brassica napus]